MPSTLTPEPTNLNKTARIACVIGACGSVALTILAGRHTPPFLLVLMSGWVLAPFAALLWTILASNRWTLIARKTLCWIALVLAPLSLTLYGSVILRPPKSKLGFMFVSVPAISWIILGLTLLLAALVSRKNRDGGGTG